MILFVLINFVIYSLVNSSEKETTMQLLKNSDDMKSYYTAKETLLRSLQSDFNCISNQDSCSGHGTCTEDKTNCVCDYGFATSKDSLVKCDYVSKKQLTAFLLELFVGFGAGHFYTERYLFASLKLVAFLFGIYIICLFPLSAKCISEKCESDFLVIITSCFYYICALGLAFWFIYDLVMFGLNKYNDGHGNALVSWGNVAPEN